MPTIPMDADDATTRKQLMRLSRRKLAGAILRNREVIREQRASLQRRGAAMQAFFSAARALDAAVAPGAPERHAYRAALAALGMSMEEPSPIARASASYTFRITGGVLSDAPASVPAADDGGPRSFTELSPSGLLWLINAAVFHPRGFALAITVRDGEAIGWDIQGDGTEPWRYANNMDHRFAAAEATLAAARTSNVDHG